jgi:S-adenosylmethionine-diacylgycerolhomoserine-N-methlytransferase
LKPSQAGKEEAGHGALMDSVYRRQRHIYNFTRKYFLFGRDRLIEELRPGKDARVLEIGCGTARNLVRLGRMHPDVSLYGLDASEAMLDTASRAVAHAGLADRVLLKRAFAEQVSLELFGLKAGFDVAIFSYSLSMIPDWRGGLLAAANVVKDGGSIRVVDFGDLRTLWAPLARGLRGWLRRFHVSPREELLSALEGVAQTGQCSLHLLPFRYAFILNASPAAIRAMLGGRDGLPG